LSVLDVVIVLLGLLVFGVGVVQLVTGRVFVGWRPRRRNLPLAFYRAYAAFYGFLGLLIAWTVLQKPFGATFQAVSGAFLSMGLIVAATWAFVIAVRNGSGKRAGQ
jgi:hypothetical protein